MPVKTSTGNNSPRKLTNFSRHFLRKFLLFLWVTPSKTLAAAQPLHIAFPLGNGGVLRSEEGEGFKKEGDGGEGEKEGKKDAQKVLRKYQRFPRNYYQYWCKFFV